MRPALHFVGFRDDRYTSAVRVFGEPDFIHRGWDRRALREIADVDTVVFADGPHDQAPRAKSFTDIHDGSEPGSPFVGSSLSAMRSVKVPGKRFRMGREG
ncbi:hypothetical protein [Antarcticirhabdus aurantiaca]|uniref:Uncharacterized protein n=1 Tax=Antarcticirhabdus aurantiaca TaxID=2606717 RepID=A0ACD4NJU0_9HYPH|nr:hypothetical protein [Antarcticirhabdus aurantiaca]WAJ27115.1 hypothetical protein OXU80_19995 [Jeongeuplla avenae]